ncbi:MAG: HDOD domain-containing protein [Planctomycetota bacterium]
MNDLLRPKPLPDVLLAAERLPTLPHVAIEVLRLCRNENTTLDDLAEVLSHDTALAARLLRFANSALYDLGHEVTSLQRAALVLGMKTVQIMALSFSLATELPRAGSTRGFDHRLFWRRSMACAVAGRTMAAFAGTDLADEAFLCGLLGEIGQLVLAQCLASEYEEVVAAARPAWPTLALEERRLGFHSADVGMALLRSWELPTLLCAGVGYMRRPHELPPDVPDKMRTLVRVGHLATLAVDLLTTEAKGKALAAIEDEAEEHFRIPPDLIYSLVTDLEPGIRETSEMLSMPLPPGLTHAEILDQAHQQLQSLDLGDGTGARGGAAERALPHRRRLRRSPALTDPAAGLPGPPAFDQFLQGEIDARRGGLVVHPLGLLLVHLENLAECRATHGEAAAGDLLHAVGARVDALVRRGDLPCRVGAEELAVVLAEATPAGLRILAERLREGVGAVEVEAAGARLTTALTMAGACLESPTALGDGRRLYEAVKHLLARARRHGPGTVEIHGSVIDPRGRGGAA